MKIEEHYWEAKKHGYTSLVLLIDYLVKERKVVRMEDAEEKLLHYLQPRFHNKMNEYLADYQKKGC